MAKIVPSEIDHYLSNHFRQLAEGETYTNPEILQKLGALAGFLELYDGLPRELIVLPPAESADLTAAIAEVRFALDRYKNGQPHDVLNPATRALPRAWELLKKLPDQFSSEEYDLNFITDPVLKKMIGVDIGAVETALKSGEWKGATVLAGSCCEALLLFGVQWKNAAKPGALSAAVDSITWSKSKPNVTDPVDQSWNLYCYTRVAEKMGLLVKSTSNELDTARDYRNLIHPSRAIREKVTCDRGAAYVAAGALDHVLRDLRATIL